MRTTLFLLIPLTLFLFSDQAFAQNLTRDGATHTINVSAGGTRVGTPEDFTIPTGGSVYDHIRFVLKGGDGGRRRVPNLCRVKGGVGATTRVTFEIGTAAGQLRPGGTVRFIVGKKGENNGSNDIAGGGGGGGTAILYKHPGAPDQGFTETFSSTVGSITSNNVPSDDLSDAGSGWVLLGVAGGGGGAYTSGTCGGSSGKGGNGGFNGTSARGGICREGRNGMPADDGGGGIVAFGNRIRESGGGGFLTGGTGGNGNQDGGYGYGAGGAGTTSDGGSGGGGGYSGGANGCIYVGGGGGGSIINISATSSNIIAGGQTYQTTNGYATYQFQDLSSNAPVALCKDTTVYLNASGTVRVTPDMVDDGSYDPLGQGIFLRCFSGACFTRYDWDCSNIGANTVDLFVLNVAGSNSNCQARITVEDTLPPVLSCPADRIYNLPSGGISINQISLTALSSDNCSGSTSAVLTQFFTADCSYLGVNNIIFRDSDAEGNAGSCTTRVTVRDIYAPAISCPANITVNTDSGRCKATVNYLVSHSDYCSSNLTQTDNSGLSSGDDFSEGITIQSYRASDGSGNADSCSFSITVVDNEAPTYSCPADTVIYAADSVCGNYFSYQVSAYDPCSGVNTRQIDGSGRSSGDLFETGFTLQSWQFMDLSGNRDTCEFTVTVLDTFPTSLLCPSDTVILLDNPTCSKQFSYQVQLAHDCFGAILSQIDSSGYTSNDSFPGGNTLQVWSFTDTLGNTDTCRFSVFINDTSDVKTTNCPSDTVVGTDNNRCWSTFSYQLTGDNCSAVFVQTDNSGISSGGQFPKGVTMQAWRLKNVRTGKSDSCSFSVTVEDRQAPRIGNCTGSSTTVSRSLGDSCVTQYVFQKNYTDNCDPGGTVIDTVWLRAGTHTVDLFASDSAGNTSRCRLTVTVNDNIRPQITCPSNIVVDADSGICGAVVHYSVTVVDNCPRFRRYAGLASGDTFPVGNTIVRWIAFNGYRSGANNSPTCSFRVIVRDTTLPVIDCPSDTIIFNSDTACGGYFNYQLSTDHCVTPGFSQIDTSGFTSGDFFPLGHTPQQWTATNSTGKSDTCLFNVTFIDTFAPEISCPSDTVMPALDSICGNYYTYQITATDACLPLPAISQIDASGKTSGDLFPVGSTLQIWVASDTSGNTDTCRFTVTVNDSTPPVALCVSSRIVTYLDTGGTARIQISDVDAGSYDNCGLASLSLNRSTWNCNAEGGPDKTVRLTATDLAGNQSTCTSRVRVNDSIPPVVVCPVSDTLYQDPGSCGAVASFSISRSDNCRTFQRKEDNSGFGNNDEFPVGTTSLSYRIFDPGNNRVYCNFSITVLDTISPQISCPANLVLYADSGNCEVFIDDLLAPSDADHCTLKYEQIGGVPACISTIYSWGTGSDASQGRGPSTIDIESPEVVIFDLDFEKVFAAIYYTHAIRKDGTLWAWGSSYASNGPTNSLGLGATTKAIYPTQVGSDSSWLSVANGWEHALAIKSDSSLWAWGSDEHGQLGNGGAGSSTVPVQIASGDKWIYAAAGIAHSVAIRADGTLWAWGLNNYGQAGTGSTSIRDIERPTQIGSASNWVAVEAGVHFSVALRADGSMWAWGADFEGTLGDGGTNQEQPSPVQIGSGGNWVAISILNEHTLALQADSSLWTWGDGSFRQLGNGPSTSDLDIPTRIGTDNDWTTISAGGVHSLALKADGSLWAWGMDTEGCLGNGPGALDYDLPAQIGTDTAWTSIAAGGIHNVALQAKNDPLPVGVTTQTFVGTDGAGNSDTCSFTITVVDQFLPVISCPSNIVITSPDSSCGDIVSYQISASDGCGIASLIQVDTSGKTSGDFFEVGVTEQKWVASDPSGNSDSCSFTITINDSTPPRAQCLPQLVRQTIPNGCDMRYPVNIPWTDNCNSGVYTDTLDLQVGVNPVNMFISDEAGNTRRCTTLFIINHNTPYTLSCPTAVTVHADSGACDAVVNYNLTATNMCAQTRIIQVDSSGKTAGDVFPMGTTLQEYRISSTFNDRDTTCYFNVTVLDSVKPQIACPANITVVSDSGQCGAVIRYAVSASDDCSPVTQSQSDSSGLTSGNLFPVGLTSQTWTATDTSGNLASCTFTVHVTDTTAPRIVCPSNIVVPNDSGACGALVNYTITSSDHCPTTVSQSDSSGLSSGDIFPVGSTAQHWKVMDSSGNLDSCSFSIVVNDTAHPIISIGPSSVNHCQFAQFVDPGYSANDNCGDLTTLVQISGNVNINVPGTYYLHYDVTDASGNVALRQTRQVIVISSPQLSTLPASVCPGTQLNIASLVRDYSMLSGLFEFYADGALVGRSPTRFGQARYPVFQTVNSDTSFTVVGTGANGCTFSAQIIVTIRSCASTLAAKALLEGAYDTTSGRMHDNLRSNNLVPITEPYSAMGYQFIGGGGEVIQSGVLATTGSNAIVDWVVIELRDSADPRSVVHSRAALLQADGDIVETDGVSTLRLDSLPTGSYYLVIWHRNHLAVMTAQPLHFDNSNVIVDFSDPNLLIYGSITGRKTVNGTALLFGGDADHNGQVQNTDNVMEWIPSAGTAGYKSADFNMDGQVQNSDLIYFWLRNAGRGSAVPR